MLGGLLSAHHLSGEDPIYLEKVVDLADRMLSTFETASGLPFPVINLGRREGRYGKSFPGLSSIAEVTTLQLEFRYLSHLTSNEKYWRAAEKVRRVSSDVLFLVHNIGLDQVMEVVKRARLPHGLASVFIT